jgi:hypothetical protein
MKTPIVPVLVALLFSAAPLFAQQTNILDEFGGKRILFVDDKNIRPDPTGERLLYVDGSNILPDPNSERILFVDRDGNVRPDPNGVRLAFWDHNELLTEPGGTRLGLLDDKTFRPEPGYKFFFYIDGPPLSRVQLTAVLLKLKPEFFKISPEQKAAKEKEMEKNAAEELAVRGADHFPGDHRIITNYVETGGGRKGSILMTKQGSFYGITFKTGDNPAWQGIGVKIAMPNGDQELWAGVAPGGAVALGIYEIKGGSLAGTWLPINAASDRSVFGFENLVGSPQLGGVYQITSGKLPSGGVAYTGALNIDPLTQALNSDGKCFRFRWATGTTGLAFRAGNRLAVAAGWGADYEILRLTLNHADSLAGDFLSKSGRKGYYTLTE